MKSQEKTVKCKQKTPKFIRQIIENAQKERVTLLYSLERQQYPLDKKLINKCKIQWVKTWRKRQIWKSFISNFSPYLKSIQQWDIQKLQLSYFPDKATIFYSIAKINFPSLTYLSLSKLQLASIEPLTWINCPQLTKIKIYQVNFRFTFNPLVKSMFKNLKQFQFYELKSHHVKDIRCICNRSKLNYLIDSVKIYKTFFFLEKDSFCLVKSDICLPNYIQEMRKYKNFYSLEIILTNPKVKKKFQDILKNLQKNRTKQNKREIQLS